MFLVSSFKQDFDHCQLSVLEVYVAGFSLPSSAVAALTRRHGFAAKAVILPSELQTWILSALYILTSSLFYYINTANTCFQCHTIFVQSTCREEGNRAA